MTKANKFALIEAIGNETAGALTFSPNNEIITSFREISNEELSQRITNRENINITLWDYKVRLSLADVQDKLPLVVLKDNKYGIGEGRIASTHILKFDKTDEKHLILNEYFCMKLAKLCGLNVAEVEIREFGTQKVLFVERFDREFISNKDGSFEISKKHIIDGCQILNLDVSMKYEAAYEGVRGNANFKNLFESSILSSNKILTKLNLLKWTLFNLCINNYDAHAKNISFFINEKGLEIAPLYDLVNIDMYPQFHNNFAMAFGDTFESSNIGAFDMVGFCVHTDIQPRLIKSEFLSIVKNIRKNVGLIRKKIQLKCTNNEIEFLEKLEKNILDTCEKYDDIFKTLEKNYKIYKEEYI